MKLVLRSALVAVVLASSLSAGANPKDKKFKARFDALSKKSVAHFKIKMAPSDDPNVIAVNTTSGPTLVAGDRMGIWTPPMLSPEDMSAVVSKHMVNIRTCYKKQLAADPEWADDMILDLAVKNTGRVSEVSISPGRVQRDLIGACLMSEVPKWKFPEFTGELDEGIQQDTVTASFPFSFSAN